jgi:ABC-type phosphate/phosphonate transport system ATPase subunit/GNAT superfamily N-acetyltransferase
MEIFVQVKSIRFNSNNKICCLNNGVRVKIHRYCCLGPGDDLTIVSENHAYVNCINGRVTILPIYSAQDKITIGRKNIVVTVKEPTTEEELTGCHKLEQYHYRGKILHGRRVPLIIKSNDPLLPNVLAYIELATAFLVNRPRAVLFNHPFEDETGVISWQVWNKDSMRRYTNIIVRIARCVVSPEFRGLGLARILVKHAIIFARNRWHVAKRKPLFLEITADMLRYVPFVESAGMHYIGETEGNLNRVKKDMKYILENFDRINNGEILSEDSVGIVEQQIHYAKCLKNIESKEGIPRDEILELLKQAPHTLSDENWNLLHTILRLPKPTFIIGLTPAAERFIIKRKRELNLPEKYPMYQPNKLNSTLSGNITIRNLSFFLDSTLIRTQNTRKVQCAFGVSKDMLRTTLFTDLNLQVRPGDIVLICGPSGAGKTSLLSLIKQKLLKPDQVPKGCYGVIEVPTNVTVQTLEPLPNSLPLVNSLGCNSFEHIMYALNMSGLAEAHLYVKRFTELSNGQRYRAMIAKLLVSGADIWVADEFCATLDPITANIVSKNLRRCAKKQGVTVILAAANWIEFIHELRQDTIIHLRSPWDYQVYNWADLKDAINKSQAFGYGNMASDTIIVKTENEDIKH